MMDVRNWIIKRLGGVPRERYENMKRSRDHWKIAYCQRNKKLKAMPVDINFVNGGKNGKA